MSVPVLDTHAEAVITALQASGVAVGDGQAPQGVTPTTGYMVVYSIPGGRSSGVLGAPSDDAEIIYQVTCVGVTAKQARWIADKAMSLLNGVTVSGRSVPLVAVESFPGLQRDDSTGSPVFTATPRFRIKSTPA